MENSRTRPGQNAVDSAQDVAPAIHTANVFSIDAYRSGSPPTLARAVVAAACSPENLTQTDTSPRAKRVAPLETRSKLMREVFLRENKLSSKWILDYVSLHERPTNKVLGDAAQMTELEACIRAKEILEAIKDGRDPFVGENTVAGYFDDVRLPWAMANKRSWKDDLGVFNRYIRRRLGQLLMRKVKPHHIQALIDDLQSGAESTERREILSPGTVYQVIAFLKAFYAWAFHRGDISINPAVQIRQLKLNNLRHVVYTGSELQAIGCALENAAPLVRLLFVLLLSLATRIGELLAATHDDVNESTCTIMLRHTKSGHPILQPMSAAAMLAYQELKTLRKPGNAHLFPAIRGDGPMSPPRKAFKKVLESAGITERRTFHDARRSAASEAITSPGVALIDVSRALNHSSVRVTEQRYLVIGEDRIRHALNQSSSSLNEQLNFHKQCRGNGVLARSKFRPSVVSICITQRARYVFGGRVSMA